MNTVSPIDAGVQAPPGPHAVSRVRKDRNKVAVKFSAVNFIVTILNSNPPTHICTAVKQQFYLRYCNICDFSNF